MHIKNKLRVMLLTSCLTLGYSNITLAADADDGTGTAATSLNTTVATSTTSIADGVTANGNTNTINIGTQGATGSTTDITIGSTSGTSTIDLIGDTAVTGPFAVTGTTTTAGIANTGNISTTTLTSTGNTTLGSGSGSSLTFGSSTGNSTISFNNNRLQNVADGVAATDAVNKRQLDKVETNLSRGIASVTAMANLPAVDSGKQFNMGFGLGSYNGENAASVGFQARIDKSAILKVSAASSDKGEAAFGAGIGISF
jgi:hypothetical protein